MGSSVAFAEASSPFHSLAEGIHSWIASLQRLNELVVLVTGLNLLFSLFFHDVHRGCFVQGEWK